MRYLRHCRGYNDTRRSGGTGRSVRERKKEVDLRRPWELDEYAAGA